MTEPERAPDILDIFASSFSWHEDAACLDTEANFFADVCGATHVSELAAGARLEPLLLCARCPVRRECLEESLRRWAVSPRSPTTRAVGCWGGSWETDRDAVKDLPLDERVSYLEETFPERLATRVASWRTRVATAPHHSRYDKRIAAMLSLELPKRVVKRFYLRGPGPGRGHRGPIAIYAATHGVSRSTAWRRLRAS